jgi:large subunit ribosomal protein L22
MEARASAKFVRMSPRKVRIIAKAVQGRRVDQAMALLKQVPKKAGHIIQKLLISAVANAEHKGATEVDALIVHSCTVDKGPILKRWMPRAMGRANRIQRRTSHVSVVVADR